MPELTIPPVILAFLENLRLLKGESRQAYLDLFTSVVSDIRPFDMMEWLWIHKFVDCMWETLRNRRYRVCLIDLQNDHALRSVILKMTPYGNISVIELEKAIERWKADPSEFVKHGIDPESVPAMALIQAAKNLEAIDRISARLEKSCDTILFQLEGRREVFAARARRAVETFRKEPTLQIEAREVTLVPESENEATPGDVASDEAAIEPTSSSEPVVEQAEGPPSEGSDTIPSTDPQS